MKRLAAVGAGVLFATLCVAQPPSRPTARDWPPVIGAWFWTDSTLEPEGYKPFLDAVAEHSPYTLLTTSLRVSKGELTEPAIREQIGKAVRYADSRGLKVAFDLDVRLARRAFQQRYPDELQQELVLKMVELPTNGVAQVSFEGSDLGDHMTGNTTPYLCLTSRVVRVYAFARGAGGIDPRTVRDVTGAEGVRSVAEGPRKLTVTVPASVGQFACVVTAHTYFAPDVFAPHLLSFQREIVRQFADLPLAGIMKDEWGFLPDFSGNPAHDRYWYSPAFARAYAKDSHGRDLVRDALLMFAAEKGRERERQAAINRYMRMCRERNAAVENDYYRAAKKTFGAAAFVGTHATWMPYPGAQEFRKNGLDWWEARRDFGQSDETTPYPCRTSLAKRWGFPLWFNQYYSTEVDDYARELWASALGGGRLNVHPLYPRPDLSLGEAQVFLLRQRFMTGISRLRMLDYITRAPLDCPVAVVFGHACAMNWAGPSYNRVGLEVASALCAGGYPSDLVPSSLIGKSALRLDGQGYVCLGPQRYRAVVLYQPEFGDKQELRFFERAARGRSAVFLVGDWTRDAEGHPLAAMARLGGGVRRCGDDTECAETCAAAVTRFLDDAGVPRVTGWTGRLRAWGQPGTVIHAAPPTDGHSILVDGTYVRIAGSRDPAGDPIEETFNWQGHTVIVNAVGVFAVRFGADGKVAALAAGGLKSMKTDGLEIALPERADVALLRQANGKMRGVVQGLPGGVPAALRAITPDWQCLTVPAPYAGCSAPNPQAIAEVTAGKRTEARVSWWGYEPADATAAIQAAINSGARRLRFENMGAPWITDKLTLASNQEIIFEQGAVVQARRGAFHGGGDCLFSAALKTNIALIGPGATLRMWKQDYDDRTQYQHAEWRHVLSFTSCSGVRVEGLTLADSGGDGIYLGVARKGVPCSDIVISNVCCVNNYRQGISVISARNLLIEDCALKDTGGTAPQAGIDFEPNEASEELVNCVMRRCVSENNKGDAFTFYLRPLRADSKPISIRLEDCRAVGSRRSVAFVTGNDNETASVRGTMDFINCRFEESREAAVVIGDKPLAGARVSFVNCEIVNPAADQRAITPIVFSSGLEGAGTIGGVRFDSCTIRDALERRPMSYQDRSGGVGLGDITGSLEVVRGSGRMGYELTPKLIAEWMPFRSFKRFARFETQGLSYEPALPGTKAGASARNSARQRGHSEWLLWAEAGDQVEFSVLVRPVGKGHPSPAPVSLISPSGRLTTLAHARGDGETGYGFKATERGAHKVVCEPPNGAATVNSPTSRVCLFSENGTFHFIGTTGQFHFWVPTGTNEFGVKVIGGRGTERVKAALLNPAGDIVKAEDNIGQAQQFLAASPSSGGALWSLRFEKPTKGVLEDFYVQLQGVPPLLACTPAELLKPAN